MEGRRRRPDVKSSVRMRRWGSSGRTQNPANNKTDETREKTDERQFQKSVEEPRDWSKQQESDNFELAELDRPRRLGGQRMNFAFWRLVRIFVHIRTKKRRARQSISPRAPATRAPTAGTPRRVRPTTVWGTFFAPQRPRAGRQPVLRASGRRTRPARRRREGYRRAA